MKKLSRHKHRIIALQVLYSLDLKKALNQEKAIKELENIKKNKNSVEMKNKNNYFYDIIQGVIKNKENLDQEISNLAINWDLERISSVERNILRIALYEIENEIPPGVAINEAVELAKEFGNEDSYSFINGILGKRVKE